LAPLGAALARLSRYAWVIFTSQNTVTVVCDHLPDWGLAPRDLAQVGVAAIGPATAAALARYGVTANLVPTHYVAEAVLQALAAATVRELGIPVAVESDEYTVPGLVRALVRYFTREAGSGKRET